MALKFNTLRPRPEEDIAVLGGPVGVGRACHPAKGGRAHVYR